MLTTTIIGAGAGVGTWVLTHFVAKPIVDIRQARLDALRIGERHALTYPPTSREEEGEVRAAKGALLDAAVALRMHLRGQLLVRFYCWCMRYDLEGAIVALGNLAELAGAVYGPAARMNILNYLYLSLNAHKTHMTRVEIAALRRMVADHKAELASEAAAPGKLTDQSAPRQPPAA